MENFYDYVIENYTLNNDARRILDSLVVWCNDHYNNHGVLMDDGIELLETVIADNIGMERQEIIDNWNEEV